MRPSVPVTFLFTDLQDSTRLWEEYPQAMHSALARHDALLRSAVEDNQGIIVKTTGDGLHAVFTDPADGLQAVLAAQLGLRTASWAETGVLKVRMGLHSGIAEEREGDYYGPVVNRAARIMGAAAGEQVLISQATAVLLDDRLPPNTSLLDLGDHYLRGVNRPVRLFQLQHPDLPSEFPSLKTVGTIPNNLPAQISSFIGREKELAEVRQLLAPEEDNHRLVTLTGPGGTGKTRLSLQAAEDMLAQFTHGVWLVELAPVTDPQAVAQAIATPLGLREQAARPLELIIVDHLRRQQVLLILDNCEHLLDECARLAELLLRSCPKLHILASSREILGITGEQSFRVRSLTLPPEGDVSDIEELAHYEAVRLFVARAVTVKSDFALNAENAPAVVQICRRLDGIPLALELAAARVHVLTPEQIAARLDDRFHLLTGGSRTVLPRQRTLQALIDWSYELLSEAECILLCRLAVFNGGWTLEAAENVAGIEPLNAYEVLDLLEHLVNKSLVVVEADELQMRYRMLETIRQYAQEKLAESGDAETIRDRHLAYYLAQSESAFEALMDLRPPSILASQYPAEADNFRTAWARSLADDGNAALRFAASFSSDWGLVVPLIEVHRFQDTVITQVQHNPEYTGPDAAQVKRLLLARALMSATVVASTARLFALSVRYATETKKLSQETGDMAYFVWADVFLTFSKALTSGREVIQQWMDEGYPRALRYGRNYMKAILLISWGSFNFFAYGQYDQEADKRWEEGMAMLRGSGNLWILGTGLQLAADLHGFRGEIVAAQQLAGQILAIYTELGDIYAANPARTLLADLARKQGDLRKAVHLYREAILIWRDSDRADAGVRILESLAFIAHTQAQDKNGADRREALVYAATLLGAVDSIRREIDRPVNFVDQAEYGKEVAGIREEMGEGAFQAAWDKGLKMDLDQAVRLATENY